MSMPSQPGGQNEAGPGAGQPPSRSAEFGTGLVGNPASAASSLNADSAKFNGAVPQGATQTSVLQSPRPSMNGMSEQDYQRVMPGGFTLPSQNGQLDQSWQASTYMRMAGQNAQ
jgi:hypothetical protein